MLLLAAVPVVALNELHKGVAVLPGGHVAQAGAHTAKGHLNPLRCNLQNRQGGQQGTIEVEPMPVLQPWHPVPNWCCIRTTSTLPGTCTAMKADLRFSSGNVPLNPKPATDNNQDTLKPNPPTSAGWPKSTLLVDSGCSSCEDGSAAGGALAPAGSVLLRCTVMNSTSS